MGACPGEIYTPGEIAAVPSGWCLAAMNAFLPVPCLTMMGCHTLQWLFTILAVTESFCCPFLPSLDPSFPTPEPNHTSIALSAVWFGWNAANGTCKHIADTYDLTEAEYESLKMGASLILAQAVTMSGVYNTTIEEDEALLKDITACRAFVMAHGPEAELPNGMVCPSDIGDWGYAIEMAVKYRREKKLLLQEVVLRLNDECVNEMGEDRVPAEQGDDLPSVDDVEVVEAQGTRDEL